MVKVVIFDMDGTITRPCINWRKLRSELGIDPDETIMDGIANLQEPKRSWALARLQAVEEEAARNSELNPGVLEVLALLKGLGIKVAVVTNNSRSSAQIMLDKHLLEFDLVLTREEGEPKPSEELLLKTISIMGISPSEAIFVGDGRYDLMAGKRAGIKTLILNGPSASAVEQSYKITSLVELQEYVKTKR